MPYHVCGPEQALLLNENRHNAPLKYYSDTLDNGKIRTVNPLPCVQNSTAGPRLRECYRQIEAEVVLNVQ